MMTMDKQLVESLGYIEIVNEWFNWEGSIILNNYAISAEPTVVYLWNTAVSKKKRQFFGNSGSCQKLVKESQEKIKI